MNPDFNYSCSHDRQYNYFIAFLNKFQKKAKYYFGNIAIKLSYTEKEFI